MTDDLVKRLRSVFYADSDLLEEAADRIEALESSIKELFVLLERVEETDEGRTLHPIQIYCCRAVDGEKLRQVLRKLKGEKNE
jgi:hypothetical protein